MENKPFLVFSIFYFKSIVSSSQLIALRRLPGLQQVAIIHAVGNLFEVVAFRGWK